MAACSGTALNIIITGTCFSFPNGTGAAVRVMSFAKGLASHGATVHVFCLKPSENKNTGSRNLHLKGVHDGIPFEYTCGQRLIARTRIGALLLYLKGLWRACCAIRRLHHQTPIDAILLWHAENPINVLVFKALAKSLGAVLIAEECEFPFVAIRKTAVIRPTMWFNDHVTYKLLDGGIVISAFLHDYFSSRVRIAGKLLRVPILVETDTFDPGAAKADPLKCTVIYCGSCGQNGEVAGLLQAFAQVAADFPQWNVQIIGCISDEAQMTELKALITRLRLEGRIEFTGERPRNEIPLLLAKGSLMALPRAGGIFSQAGFPTKLGEYLASGRPVVVTNTGDIPQYLQDRVNAFLTPPGDTAAFARALRYVMSHPEEAREAGRRGREVAVTQFSSQVQGARIIEFIRALRTAG